MERKNHFRRQLVAGEPQIDVLVNNRAFESKWINGGANLTGFKVKYVPAATVAPTPMNYATIAGVERVKYENMQSLEGAVLKQMGFGALDPARVVKNNSDSRSGLTKKSFRGGINYGRL